VGFQRIGRPYPSIMDAAWIARTRWRWRGAWMWPAFVVLAIADGWIGHALPINPPRQSVISGIVVGLVLNLICIVVLSPVFGALLRRVRRDLPVQIARNYAGVLCVLLVTVGFVGIGLAKRSTITHDSAAMHDAAVSAAGYIGDHAPAAFAARAAQLDVLAIEDGSIYRVCVDNAAGTRYYCVVVREGLPFARSVRPDGSEPNAALARGDD
jgi:hypothetical protein